MKTFWTNPAIGLAHTRTLFTETNAGGRAAFALESVAAMDYIFSVQNVVVVHHSFCGTTTLTPELLIEEFHDHYHADITTMFDHDSLAIMDFEKSIKHDIAFAAFEPGGAEAHQIRLLLRNQSEIDRGGAGHSCIGRPLSASSWPSDRLKASTKAFVPAYTPLRISG